MWVFERRSTGGYRYAEWHSPERTGRDSLAYAVGDRLIGAAGLLAKRSSSRALTASLAPVLDRDVFVSCKVFHIDRDEDELIDPGQ